jgi:thioredoxin 1
LDNQLISNKKEDLMVAEFNRGNFESEVLKSDIPVVVDFWAEWCGPCHMITPVVEKLEKQYKGKVKFGKLNVDENREIAVKYQVMSIPLLLFFKEGKQVDSSIGAVPEGTIKPKVEALLS